MPSNEIFWANLVKGAPQYFDQKIQFLGSLPINK
jgi:hypothetical protein